MIQVSRLDSPNLLVFLSGGRPPYLEDNEREVKVVHPGLQVFDGGHHRTR